MRFYPVKAAPIKIHDDLVEVLLNSMRQQHLELEDNDVLVLSSKIVAYSEGRVMALADVEPSEKARQMAKQYSLSPEFAELVLREADEICGGVEKAVLTLKAGVMVANAGIDGKNAPLGHVVLWPTDPRKSAENVRNDIRSRTGKRVAVVIVDSGLIPLRIGTVGLALAVAGFKPIRDNRGKPDLYGRTIAITRQAIADDVASAAHLLIGEADERIPAVIVKDAPVRFDEKVYGLADMMMPFEECIFMNGFRSRCKKIAT